MHPDQEPRMYEVLGDDVAAADGMVTYLSVQAKQIEASSRFAEKPIDSVIDCLIEIMTKAKEVQASIPLERESAHLASRSILELCNRSIQNLQFSDELTQRLEHTHKSLNDLAMHVEVSGQSYNEINWSVIEELVQTRYSTEAERDIHASGYGEGDSKE